MLVLLPVLALGTCVLVLEGRLHSWRTAILGGAVLWGSVLAASTEALSAFHHLGVVEVAATWAAVLVLSGISLAADASRSLWSARLHARQRRAPPLLVVALCAQATLLAVVAVVSPPNTWDSMTYHMARVIHWTQNASLAPYPTHILRQLYLQPGAEFVILHLHLLSGVDRFAGLVQWAAMVGALIGTSLIARELGAGQRAQIVAGVLTATLPIGILESTSTQNDYVVAFWLAAAVACGLGLCRVSGAAAPWPVAFAFGASVGLALLTKATAYLYVAPFVAWAALSLFRSRGWRAVPPLAVVGLLACALNVGVFARNLAVFGSPSGPLSEGPPNDSYVNAALTPQLLASNVVRDVAVNLVATPLAPLNAAADAAVHTVLGAAADDPRITWGTEAFTARSPGLAFDENFASNPVQLVLLLGAVLAGLGALSVGAFRRPRGDAPRAGRDQLTPACIGYALSLAAAFVLFCAVLRWQPWHTRLELPLFVLGAPLIATVLDRFAQRALGPLAVVLLVTAVPWVVYNQARPLVGPRSILTRSRADQYFTNQPGLQSPYLGAVGFLAARACGQIGFISSPDGWEYPLWPLLAGSVPGPVSIEDVAVANVSAAWRMPDSTVFLPCAIVSIDEPATPLDLDGTTFRPAWTTGPVSVLTPDGS